MKTKWPPDPDAVLADLEPLFKVAYPTLDWASDHAVQIFEIDQASIEASLHAHLTRHHAGRRLDLEIESTGFVRRPTPNSGLLLTNDQYAVRILKAGHEIDPDLGEVVRRLPFPHSRARREYYRQPTLFQLDLISPPVKLLLLWDVDASYQLCSLDLACPKTAARTRDSVEHYWYVSIADPRPGDAGMSPTEKPSPPLRDIGIRPRRLEETGTDGNADIR